MKVIYSLFCLIVGLASALGAKPSERPNFLFIYTDDQRYDAMGVVQREQGDQARFPWFKTPNMDRLAAEGVRFRNAFVTSSLCAPSRAAFLTGRYNHLNGVANNHTEFPVRSVTHATVLRGQGYKTGYVGKWHMSGQRGKRPGFDFCASFIGHGRYQDCPFEIDGVSKPTKGWVDDVSTDFAIAFMRTNRSNPFSLVVGFKSPHDPRTPPPRLKDAFAGEVCRPAPNETAFAPYLSEEEKEKHAKVKPVGSETRLNYFRCIAGADQNLGRLLKALDDFGLTEKTMVIYTSDNGYYLGEHGLSDKRSAYEESMRVPLLLRYPKLGLKGVVIDEPVLNIDLAPTLIDFAGIRVPRQMQGESWYPLLVRKEGSPVKWRTSFFYEYFFEENFAVPTVTAVRSDDSKLIQYPGHADWTEVYELRSDPYETNNLATNAADKPLRSKLLADFNREARKVGFRIPSYADKPDEPQNRRR